MADVVREARASVVLMHMQGTPRTMQRAPRYRHVVSDVRRWLLQAIRSAEARGIRREQILIDPGIGFGKTVEQNLQLMRHVNRLTTLGPLVVLGPSRKSFIGKITGADVPADRLGGTLACVSAAAAGRVAMVRVHDVKPAVQFLRMSEAMAHAR